MSNYDDIIRMPYPIKPQRMTNYDRAAQFSPFAALTGHEEAVAETARLTETAIELGEDGIAILNEKLALSSRGRGSPWCISARTAGRPAAPMSATPACSNAWSPIGIRC